MGASLCCNKCAGGGEFRKNGVWPSLYDVAVSWLRLQTPIDCIPHPYWMYNDVAGVMVEAANPH